MKNFIKCLVVAIFVMSSTFFLVACDSENELLSVNVFLNDVRMDKISDNYTINMTNDFSSFDLKVLGVFDDDSESEIFMSTNNGEDGGYVVDFGGFDAAVPGIYVVTVSYKEFNPIKFQVVVVDTSLKSIEIVTPATKMNYSAFESFDRNCLVVKANYANNQSSIVNNSQLSLSYVSGMDSFRAGETRIGLSYGGFSVDLDGIVVSKKIPQYTLPTLIAKVGDTLADVVGLTTGFSFVDPTSTIVGNSGIQNIELIFTPSDSVNYNVVTGLFVPITISKSYYSNISYPYSLNGYLSATYDANKSLSFIDLADGFSWKNPNEIPTVNKTSYQVVYNMDSNNYYDFELTVILRLEKAVPLVTSWPNIEDSSTIYMYQTLNDVGFLGGTVNTPGRFAWANKNTLIDSTNAKSYSMTFTPNDLINYYPTNVDINLTSRWLTISIPDNVIVQRNREGSISQLNDGDNLYWNETLVISSTTLESGYSIKEPLKVNDVIFLSGHSHTVISDVNVNYLVVGTQLIAVSIISNPNKTNYYHGEYVNLNGLTFKLHYNNGNYEEYEYSAGTASLLKITYKNGTSFSENDDYFTLTAKHRNPHIAPNLSYASINIPVVVTRRQSVVTSWPTIESNSSIFVGQTLSDVSFSNGINVTSGHFEWADLSYKISTNEKFNAVLIFVPDDASYNSLTNNYEIEATYLRLTTTGNVSVSVLRNNSTVNLLNNANLYWNEILTISATPISGYAFASLKVNGSDFVSGNTFTATGNVFVQATVDEIELTSLQIVDNPNKTAYFVGDTLDTDGLEVEYTLSDGTSVTINSNYSVLDFIYNSGSAFAFNDTFVTLSFTYENPVSHTQTTLSKTIAVSVSKITLEDITYPYGDNSYLSDTYVANRKLSSIDLADGFSWKNPDVVPTVNVTSYEAIYNPNTSVYLDFPIIINLHLTKTDMDLSGIVLSVAENVRVGNKLSAYTITTSSSIAGSFSWVDPDHSINSVLDKSYAVSFVPTDTINYNTAIVTLTVDTVYGIASVSWNAIPTKYLYLTSDVALDVSGGVLKILYTDGVFVYENLNILACNTIDFTIKGEKSVGVSITKFGQNYSLSFDILVVDTIISSGESIQSSINSAVSGQYLAILEGTYYEALSIKNKNLIIYGIGNVVVAGPTTDYFTSLPAVSLEGYNTALVSIVSSVSNLNNIIIKGNPNLATDRFNHNSTGYNYNGMLILNSIVSMKNCKILDTYILNNDSTHGNNTMAIRVFSNADGIKASLSMQNCEIKNFNLRAICLKNKDSVNKVDEIGNMSPTVVLSLDSCTIEGVGSFNENDINRTGVVIEDRNTKVLIQNSEFKNLFNTNKGSSYAVYKNVNNSQLEINNVVYTDVAYELN